VPDFAYTARDLSGQKVTGVISAQSQREAIAQLTGQSLFPVDVTASEADKPARLTRGRVRGQLMAATYAQLAALLRNGVALLRSLVVLRDQTSNATLKAVLDDVHSRVEEGESLADAFARHPRTFSEMAVNMVRAGGEGGFLEDALDRVATFTEQQEELKSRTLGALAYPIFLIVVGTAVVTCLLIFFVPSFEPMFERLRERSGLPAVTEGLLGFSKFLGRWWIPLLVGVVVLAVMFRSQLATESGRRWKDRVKLKLPLIGPIFQNLAVARFCRVLGTLLKNGVPILRSLEISSKAAGNRVISEAIDNAAGNITQGESLARPLAASGYFPSTVVEMIAVAEEANTLDTVLVDIADGLERRTFRRLELAVRLIEPVMLLLLAGVVLLIVLALLLPILKMSSTI